MRDTVTDSLRTGKTPRSGRPWLVWGAAGLAAVILLVLLVPWLVERIQYAAARGRQRAAEEAKAAGLAGISLKELSQAYQQVSRDVAKSVVHIQTSPPSGRPAARDELLELYGPPGSGALPAQGSGVIVDAAGYIVTNYHVVRSAGEIQVLLDDGRKIPAHVIGTDALTDLAVLKVETAELPAAAWGDSDALEVGALVWAVGSPFGLQHSITCGIVSAKHRQGLAGNPFQDFLQTDAAVNPGNSGGPLVDAEGRVIGINTAILGSAYQGISFAIPSSVARDVYQRLKAQGHVARGWLGVALDEVPDEQRRQLGLADVRGARVVSLGSDTGPPSPAREAGLRVGDILLRWNGSPIDSPMTLSRLVAATPIGSRATAELLRDGQPLTVAITVRQRPEAP